MLKKFILISGLSLSIFSMAHADAQKENITTVEKYNIESAMNIFKDAKSSNIDSNNVDEFLLQYDVGNVIKQQVKDLISQNFQFNDVKKLDYGVYQIKKLSPNSYPYQVPNSYCHSAPISPDSCLTSVGSTCTWLSSQVCS